jgi:hypothetical protein
MNKKNRRVAIGLFSALILLGNASPSSAAATLKISEAGNGKTFSVKAGSAIEITLHSTFWNEQNISNLKSIGTPNMNAIMPGPTAPANCQLPGMGCGTIVWKFTAAKPGKASFLATRTSCGEALRCTAKTGRFLISFKVS